MELLTRPPPHQDAPMDLRITARRMLGHSSWIRHAQVECAMEPSDKTKPEGRNKYIPIPKKRHCHAPQPQDSHKRECPSPSPVRYLPSASAKLRTRHSLSPKRSQKRARMESPKPSDLCCDLLAQLPSSAARNDTVSSFATSPTTAVSASDNSSEWPELGVGLAGANSEVVVASEGVSQSVMKPRQRGHPSSTESSYDRSSPSLRENSNESMPPAHVFTALLHMQSAAMSQGMLPTALKDTEALLSAVHQSQMLYYSYCSQLINTLRTNQIEQQTQHQQQHHHSHYPLVEQQQQHLHQLHQPPRLYQHKQPRHPQQQIPEQPPLTSESESEGPSLLEEARHYESDDTNEDFHTVEDDTLSILRTRLNSQKTQQLCLEQRSPSADSPSGILPSSTTGGEDIDLSQMEASGGTRKRAPRALTGKHVRPGTGASASTLITLRQKLQERQKYREVYGVDPPQPTKPTKGRSKKR